MLDKPPINTPVTWDEQVQKAVDCYNAGARLLHIHVRDPKTGKISKNFAVLLSILGILALIVMMFRQ